MNKTKSYVYFWNFLIVSLRIHCKRVQKAQKSIPFFGYFWARLGARLGSFLVGFVFGPELGLLGWLTLNRKRLYVCKSERKAPSPLPSQMLRHRLSCSKLNMILNVIFQMQYFTERMSAHQLARGLGGGNTAADIIITLNTNTAPSSEVEPRTLRQALCLLLQNK